MYYLQVEYLPVDGLLERFDIHVIIFPVIFDVKNLDLYQKKISVSRCTFELCHYKVFLCVKGLIKIDKFRSCECLSRKSKNSRPSTMRRASSLIRQLGNILSQTLALCAWLSYAVSIRPAICDNIALYVRYF